MVTDKLNLTEVMNSSLLVANAITNLSDIWVTSFCNILSYVSFC